MLLCLTINGRLAVWLCFCVDALAAMFMQRLLQTGQQVVFHHCIPAHVFRDTMDGYLEFIAMFDYKTPGGIIGIDSTTQKPGRNNLRRQLRQRDSIILNPYELV